MAGRDRATLAAAYDEPDVTAETVDITDDESIAALAERVGPIDHIVSTASARARGTLADLDRASLQLSFDTKVIGPTMLAKHFASRINAGGSFVLFSGVHAFKAKVGYLGVAITNGAADFLTRSLAIELAAHQRVQSHGHHRHPGGRGRGSAVRDDQRVSHRHDTEDRRRRTADLTRVTAKIHSDRRRARRVVVRSQRAWSARGGQGPTLRRDADSSGRPLRGPSFERDRNADRR
ncbi:MAG: hypothetical protein QOH20_3605 [Mycobacterium sp.]|nr:hypothetical protein [Mycobacterium sp.]